MKTHFLIFLTLLSSIELYSQKENESRHHSSKPGSHAPIGIMADHTHNKGEWMFSYRYMHMNMEDLKRGSDDVPFASALENYMVTPIRMPMNMHMIGVMYAPTDKLTLALMSSYISKEMDHVTRMGGVFTTNSSGIGDTRIKGLYRLIHKETSKLHAEVGISIPTGSIQERDVIPVSAPNTVILPYPMQIGSGTWDGIIGLTYLFETEKFNFGLQGRSTLRTGTNDNNYRLGNQYEINGWTSYNINSWLSVSARLQGQSIETIKGANPALNPLMVITADTNNTGGELFNGVLGFNILLPNEIVKGLRFGLEFKNPLYQNLNGFQLKRKESFTLGVQYSL